MHMTADETSEQEKNSNYLLVSFKPDAIREHFEDYPELGEFVEGLTDDELLDVGTAAVENDQVWATFHEVLVFAVEIKKRMKEILKAAEKAEKEEPAVSPARTLPDSLITVGDGPWHVALLGDAWYLYCPTMSHSRKGWRKVGPTRNKGRNYFDRAVTEAEKRNAEHARRSVPFTL